MRAPSKSSETWPHSVHPQKLRACFLWGSPTRRQPRILTTTTTDHLHHPPACRVGVPAALHALVPWPCPTATKDRQDRRLFMHDCVTNDVCVCKRRWREMLAHWPSALGAKDDESKKRSERTNLQVKLCSGDKPARYISPKIPPQPHGAPLANTTKLEHVGQSDVTRWLCGAPPSAMPKRKHDNARELNSK